MEPIKIPIMSRRGVRKGGEGGSGGEEEEKKELRGGGGGGGKEGAGGVVGCGLGCVVLHELP